LNCQKYNIKIDKNLYYDMRNFGQRYDINLTETYNAVGAILVDMSFY